jgi:uncharacterized OsmC-like protein
LQGDGIDPQVVEHVHSFHASKCPVARSIEGAIEVTTDWELLPLTTSER